MLDMSAIPSSVNGNVLMQVSESVVANTQPVSDGQLGNLFSNLSVSLSNRQQQTSPPPPHTTHDTDGTESAVTALSNTSATRTYEAVFSSMPPHLVVPRVSSELPEGDCAICCDKFTNGQLAMRLSCGHAFHSPCWQIYFRANL